MLPSSATSSGAGSRSGSATGSHRDHAPASRGANPSYGYRTGKDGWVVNASEERIARRLRLRAQQALSYSGIARKLNGEGVKTPARRESGPRRSCSACRAGAPVLGEFNHAGEMSTEARRADHRPGHVGGCEAIGEQESNSTREAVAGPYPNATLYLRARVPALRHLRRGDAAASRR